MNAKSTIALSAVLHLVFVGYLYTLDVPEQVEAGESTLRRFAGVQMRMVQADEVSEDGSDDPARGVPNPAPEPEKTAEPKSAPQPEPEPESVEEPEPTPEPPKEPEPEDKPELASNEELKSVVTDKTDTSDSPVETDSEAEETAEAVASTAPVDSGDGTSAGRGHDERGASGTSSNTPNGTGSGSKASGPQGIREGSGEEQKKLNQKYGLILYREINKVKSYPRFARKANIEGKLTVAITVDRRGKILKVELRESSGHKILDRNTLETIRNLKQFPVPPSELAWDTKTYVLPVNYKLT